MKVRFVSVVALVLLLVLAFAVVAQAAVPQSVIDAIIEDAKDGTIDGNWSAAEIQAALDYIENDPLYAQYSDLRGLLEDYLASLQDPGTQGGQLAFTGSEVLLILAAGAGLIGGGALLRRSRA